MSYLYENPLGYRRFQIGSVFAEYDPFKPTIFKQNFICLYFCINLTKFDINFSRQEHQIEFSMCLDQLLKCVGFSLYPL